MHTENNIGTVEKKPEGLLNIGNVLNSCGFAVSIRHNPPIIKTIKISDWQSASPLSIPIVSSEKNLPVGVP